MTEVSLPLQGTPERQSYLLVLSSGDTSFYEKTYNYINTAKLITEQSGSLERSKHEVPSLLTGDRQTCEPA